jgi:hypothetical protein
MHYCSPMFTYHPRTSQPKHSGRTTGKPDPETATRNGSFEKLP